MLICKKFYLITAKIFAVILFFFLSFTGCFETTEEIPITMTLSSSSFNFDHSGGEESLSIESNTKDWLVNSNQFWLKVSPASGAGKGTVTIEVAANAGSLPRTALLTISGTGVSSRTIEVKQAAGLLPTLDESWRAAIQTAMSASTTITSSVGQYKGQQSGGNPHGLGAILFSERRDFYFGEWKNGRRDGLGIYIYASFTDDMSFVNCPNAKIYVGDIESDLFSGTGSCYDKTGTIIYDGVFENDKPKSTYPSTHDLSVYKFEIINYSSGIYYIGETVNGKCEGIGIYVSNGDIMLVTWKDGKQEGYGIYITRNGNIQTGTWKNGVYVG